MAVTQIPYQRMHYFSTLMSAYLSEDGTIQPFYNRFPKMDNFDAQIQEKQTSFSEANRKVLVKSLNQQYAKINTSEATQHHIDLLGESNTFTITTGHQLNLFTGPLYFLYKIISTINLCEELRVQHPNQNFVPVYWMATEDHDFDEINHFHFNEQKVTWNRQDGGAVGELSTEGLQEVFEVFSKQLGAGTNAETLRELFADSYLKHDNLADATRYLANALFGQYGLVIVDANCKDLKQLFIPYVKEEITQQTSFKQVSETITNFPKGYKIQVNPREINLFYIQKGMRERIVFENNNYQVLNTDIQWSKTELLKKIEDTPECFSPNVLLRPLYQEVILPNLCYIGGGGELAYWLELQSTFSSFIVPFPMLLLRNSALVVSEKQSQKLSKLKVEVGDLFLPQTELVSKITKRESELHIDLSIQKDALLKQFKELYALAKQTDASFVGAVSAQEKKQLKGLQNLEKRLLKAEKRKYAEILQRITNLQNELFPKQSLQERKMNFSELYLEYGTELIPMLINALQPLSGNFTILK